MSTSHLLQLAVRNQFLATSVRGLFDEKKEKVS